MNDSSVRGRFARLDQIDEVIEQSRRVVWPGARLGMALKTEHRLVVVVQALQTAVEQRAVRGAHVGRQRALVDREAVVLAGDHHAAALDVEHGMIRAMVTELQQQQTNTTSEPQ